MVLISQRVGVALSFFTNGGALAAAGRFSQVGEFGLRLESSGMQLAFPRRCPHGAGLSGQVSGTITSHAAVPRSLSWREPFPAECVPRKQLIVERRQFKEETCSPADPPLPLPGCGLAETACWSLPLGPGLGLLNPPRAPRALPCVQGVSSVHVRRLWVRSRVGPA